MSRQGRVKIELEAGDDASLDVDKHESSIRVGGMPMVTSAMKVSAATSATVALCASSPRRSKRKLEGVSSLRSRN